MNEGLKKMEELLRTDTAFQEKLKAAMESYTGEQKEEAVFNAILVPLAKEYGISASFDEFKEYIQNVLNEDRELSDDEVNQVAGGTKGGGLGIGNCIGVGIGAGGGAGESGCGICAGLGIGSGDYQCAGSGS